jgi:ubiquitin C-terminal hydrolase
MNSGLQCLSATEQLSKYFLQGIFKSEINENNPLGTGGSLVRKYANFIYNVWNGDKGVFSPWGLKQAIGQFQSMVILTAFCLRFLVYGVRAA